MEARIIADDLRVLGVGRQYRGYVLVIKAVRMVLQDEKKLLSIKSGVYVPLSDEAGCDWRAVERNIRTVIRRAWHVNPRYINTLAGYSVCQEPTVTEFVEMLSNHILQLLA